MAALGIKVDEAIADEKVGDIEAGLKDKGVELLAGDDGGGEGFEGRNEGKLSRA